MIDPANTSESEHRYYEQLYYDRLESDAELCRALRAFLLDQMEIIKGCVVKYKWLGNDTLTAKLNDLLVAVRDGGAK